MSREYRNKQKSETGRPHRQTSERLRPNKIAPHKPDKNKSEPSRPSEYRPGKREPYEHQPYERQPDTSIPDENLNLILEGRKSVLEALNHEKPIDRILLRRDRGRPLEGTLKLIAAKAKNTGIVVQEVERAALEKFSESGNHQGVIAVCPAKEYVDVADILALAKERNEAPFIMVLDGITDPHNLGAIIRTAEAGGVHGVIIPKRRAVGLTGVVAKTSAGAIEHIPVARVTNLTRTLEDLKAAGLWIACADMKGSSLFETDMSGPIALVIGAEGSGVSRLVAEQADFNIRIPMLGKIEALNASVAAGILIYEVVRGRHRK